LYDLNKQKVIEISDKEVKGGEEEVPNFQQ
jgi:hypothetical protein